jgi:hypothetical protein
MGRLEANFHCSGTPDDDHVKFIRSASGTVKNGAPIRRNQAGMLSRLVAVGRNVFGTLNGCRLVMGVAAEELFAVALTLGTV